MFVNCDFIFKEKLELKKQLEYEKNCYNFECMLIFNNVWQRTGSRKSKCPRCFRLL